MLEPIWLKYEINENISSLGQAQTGRTNLQSQSLPFTLNSETSQHPGEQVRLEQGTHARLSISPFISQSDFYLWC